MTDPQLFPDDQQENEDDIESDISFKDAVVLNADWTIETINSQIKKGNIDLQPGFQRRSAWDEKRKSRLMESIIVGMPVPNIVLAENKEHRGRFIVIDGKQRLLSINDFLDDKFKLKGVDIRKDLNDLLFSELPIEDREYLENATLRSTIIRNWNDENFLYTIFFRLNSGSLPLSPQELRKALIGGNLLENIEHYLSTSPSFAKVFGGTPDKRMRDSELVLRFLAFDRNLEAYRGDFKEFLDNTTRYFESDWSKRSFEAAEGLKRLDAAIEVSHSLFGGDTFKKWLGGNYERVINRAIFDCLVRFFADPAVFSALPGHEIQLIDAFKARCLDQNFKNSIEKTTKSLNSTYSRIDSWGEDVARCIGKNYDKATHRIV